MDDMAISNERLNAVLAVGFALRVEELGVEEWVRELIVFMLIFGL